MGHESNNLDSHLFIYRNVKFQKILLIFSMAESVGIIKKTYFFKI